MRAGVWERGADETDRREAVDRGGVFALGCFVVVLQLVSFANIAGYLFIVNMNSSTSVLGTINSFL